MTRNVSGPSAAWVILTGLAIALSAASVLLSYWLLDISLPTLMSVSYGLLLVGTITCWPAVDRAGTHPAATLLLMLGQSSGVAVLILFFIRLYKQEILFCWV